MSFAPAVPQTARMPLPSQMGATPPTDPMQLLAALRGLVGDVAEPPTPIYRSGYTKPKKPDPAEMLGLGKSRKQDYLARNWLYDKIIKQLRLQLVGVFPEDIADREAGMQEEFISTALVDEQHLAAAFLAGLAYTADKTVLDPVKRAEAQMVEDAVMWLREQDLMIHSDLGNGPLPMDEAKILLTYGMIVSRDVMDLRTPEMPWDSVLLDPATIFPEWGGRLGLTRVWQVTRTTLGRILGDYDPPSRIVKQLKGDVGGDETDEVEFTDFWDSWHHIAYAGDLVIHNADHEYGYVPFTIQYGPSGDAMFTSTPGDIAVKTVDGRAVGPETRWQDDLSYKALPYVFYLARQHEQYEAIMARLLTGMKKDINPPVIEYVSNIGAGNDRPPLEAGPGGVTERSLEDHKVQAYPTLNNMGATQTLLAGLVADRQAGSLAAQIAGQNQKSNVTGVAANTLIDQGYDRLVPWQNALESFHTRRASQRLLSWRNFGYLAAYPPGKPSQPLVIPKRRPRQGDAPAFELTTELLDRVGPTITVKLNRINPAQWLPLATAANQMKELGLFDPRFFAPWFGITDIDRVMEEAREYQGLQQALNHPKFAELFTIPTALMAEIKDEGDPARREVLITMLEMWLETITKPTMAPPGAEAGPGAGPGGPMGGPMAGGAPPMSQGVSFPALGQGPGSQTGMTGRPAGVPGA